MQQDKPMTGVPTQGRSDAWLKLGRRFMAFTSVGAVGTLAHYLTLVLLVEGLGSKPSLGTALGFLVGAIVNYSLNYTFTFRSNARHRAALPKFLFIAAVGFCLNTSMMQWGVTKLGVHYLLVQLLATGTVLIWSFTGSLLWAFRGREHG